ncbi:MAG: fused MFS/spermidine synthase [Vicinamibacteria bacterium]|nr:fused MFS/spermidine synthase [Vicinamibacteria bacterium]
MPHRTRRDSSTPPTWALVLVGVGFFLSGASALVYQVGWQRILALHSGVGIYSIAIIVSAFMAGMGLGSSLGGVASARFSPRQALLLFAVIELAIAAFGVLSPVVFYDLLYLRAAWLYGSLWRAGLLHFASLIVPTTLMGMSLPFLVRAAVGDAATAGRVVGLLYGINVLGASLGALAAPWLLIRFFGISGALRLAAAGNVIVALLALVIGWSWIAARTSSMRSQPAAERDTLEEKQPFALWLALYAFSGFLALSLEILWFRIVSVAVKSNSFTFGAVLFVYLFGCAAGSLGGALFVHRVKRPLRAFLLCQIGILLYASAGALLLVVLPLDAPGYRLLVAFWQGGNRVTADAVIIARLFIVFPAVLYGPAAILMGMSFPILQRAVHDDADACSRKVGWLQTANISGCVLGSLLTGLAGLHWLGTTGSLRALLLIGLLFAFVGFRRRSLRPLFGAMGAMQLMTLAMAPSNEDFWLRLHGTTSTAAIVDEDATGVGAIVRLTNHHAIYTDGKAQSQFPFGGTHTYLGVIPLVIHPDPQEVVIIGLGSANTAWAAGCRNETRRLIVYEICAPQHRLLTRIAAETLNERGMDARFDHLRSFLRDPRVDLRVADGRSALESDARLFDVIEADALWPEFSYSGNVYSREFFTLCARRLKPGGLACTWVPTQRVGKTFRSVFPYSIRIHDRGILIGSLAPISIDVETWSARLNAPDVTRYLGGPAAIQHIHSLLAKARPAAMVRKADIGFNHDLFPRDEFVSPPRF